MKDAGFMLIISDLKKSWKKTVEADEIEKMRKQTTLSKLQYEISLNMALTSSNDEYFIEFNTKNATLIIRKKLMDDDMKIRLAEAKLKETDIEEFSHATCNYALVTTATLKEKIKSLEREKKNAENNNEKLTEVLKEATEAKLNLENDLYQKFLAVLNAKKRKIRELEDGLGESSSISNKDSNKDERATEEDDIPTEDESTVKEDTPKKAKVVTRNRKIKKKDTKELSVTPSIKKTRTPSLRRSLRSKSSSQNEEDLINDM
ncbi:DgyrCDS8335 [Dimorphilus gyrociliatus]|uniref:DgyrCDS8335 n=1 Tax=Dimorphilus gyrociliatus TaxID=2664684 RepID=A0A7I8VTV5_9ANNE|nr:DgyrCDS8335 [Dimorphilus gyrociliatus]